MAVSSAPSRLKEYARKRRFDVTTEPPPKPARASRRRGLRFVVQKHAASRLHYDFRLEWDGVLLSWAVPKGPSGDKKVKRLARAVEDHPLAYADFEGVIPAQQYGGGTVMVWDRGTYEPRDADVGESLAKGHIVFSLVGKKLKGEWVLVRTGGRESPSWLLIKHGDDDATTADVVEREPRSVVSKRLMAEIAFDEGGDVERAAATDPADAIRVLMQDPKTGKRKPHKQPVVWQSKPRQAQTARGGAGRIEVAGVALSHPERVIYPDQGLTKLEIARFYESISDWILPHIAGRPLTLLRCPDGIGAGCFFMKHAGAWTPTGVRKVEIREKRKVGEYLVVDDVTALVALVQANVVELHTWNATVERVEHPDRIVFDLDPGPEVKWNRIVEAARLVRAALEAIGLESFVKTTGGRGLHVVAPLVPEAEWQRGLAVASDLAEAIARSSPKDFTTTFAKAGRERKILVDIMRNNRLSTSVAAFSTRARPGAPISTPLAWEELERLRGSDQYTVGNLKARLVRLRTDPWAAYWKCKQRLPSKSPARLRALEL